jgi:hypothetical protein
MPETMADVYTNGTTSIKIADVKVFHIQDKAEMKVNVKIEKNSKGYNWEVTVTSAPNTAVAIAEIVKADAELAAIYNPL